MDKPLPLDAALSAFDQAASDLRTSLDAAQAMDQIAAALAMTTCLQAMRYVEKNGLTAAGRRQLKTGIESCRAALGVGDPDDDEEEAAA